MSVQLQDRYDPMFTTTLSPFESGFTQSGASALPWASSSDDVTRALGPWEQNSSEDSAPGYSGSGLPSIVTQLLSIVSQLMSQIGNGFGSIASGGAPNQQYFASASGGSNGDPHLTFDGSTWNDMQSESHLLDSNSIPGGYRLSTQTTAPSANGITYNQQATITTDYGQTQVTLDKNGNATYTQNGITNAIANGQTVNLGNGERATRNQDGSLTIINASPAGGRITTTMSQNGNGVNVNVTASNVDLGGILVNGSSGNPPTPQAAPAPPPFNRPTPIRYDW